MMVECLDGSVVCECGFNSSFVLGEGFIKVAGLCSFAQYFITLNEPVI